MYLFLLLLGDQVVLQGLQLVRDFLQLCLFLVQGGHLGTQLCLRLVQALLLGGHHLNKREREIKTHTR